jgi:hypothetical protein
MAASSSKGKAEMGDLDGVALLQKLQLSVAEKDEILMEKDEILTEKGASLSLQKNKVALEEGDRLVQ